MQIVIEIDEEEYETIKASVNKSSSDYKILNGTPLDKIKADIERNMSVKPNDFNQHDESERDRGLLTALCIIDRHTREVTE